MKDGLIAPGSFWMVWDPQGRSPSHRHSSRDAAEAEAKRLAAMVPEHSFVVLEALHAYRVKRPEPPPVEQIDLAKINWDEIPF